MYCIDRFEGEIAVCETENREKLEILKAELYKNAKEGDCFEKAKNGYCFLEEETKKRRLANLAKLKKIMKS